MDNIDGNTITIVLTALLAGSELLSLIPQVRSNGWCQLVFAIIRKAAGK